MHQYLYAGDEFTYLVHAGRGEATMNRAVTLPQNDFGSPELICGEPTIALMWIKDDTFIERNAQFEHGCIAA